MLARTLITIVVLLTLVACPAYAVRPGSQDDHAAKKIENLQPYQIARLVSPVNTIPLAEQLGMTDTVVVWFSFELTQENRATDLKLEYNPGPPEAATAARTVMDTLTFWVSPFWTSVKRFYYGLPICPTCKSRESGPAHTWDSLMVELNLTDAGLPRDCIDSGQAVYPTMTYQAEPAYPREAKLLGIGGTVLIQCVLDTTGLVLAANVKESSGNDLLDLEALKAGYSCRFTPARCKGEAIPCHVAFAYQFASSQEPLPDIPDYATPTGADSTEIYPEMIKPVQPDYPRSARNAGHEGTVWVQCLVDKQGKVQEARVLHSSGYESLDKAALKAARKCEFSPGMQDGKPVLCWLSFKYDFYLHR